MKILEQKAKEAGMTKSEFIRRVIRHGAAHPKTNFSREDRSRLQHEIDRIGNNLNLIGYIASGQNNSSVDEVEVLKLIDNYKKLLGKYMILFMIRSRKIICQTKCVTGLLQCV